MFLSSALIDSGPGRAVDARSLRLAIMAMPSMVFHARKWIRIVLLGVLVLSVVGAHDVSLVGALVVNLDVDAARWTSMVQKLMTSSLIRDTQLGYSRIRGVWAPELDLQRFVLEDKLTLGAYNDIVEQDSVVTGETLTLGALGCLESHVQAWRRVVEIDAPMLILEDDVTFSVDFDAGLAAVLTQLPADFGLLYLANVVGDVIVPNLRHYNVRSDVPVAAVVDNNSMRSRICRIFCGPWTAVIGARMHTWHLLEQHGFSLRPCTQSTRR